MLRYECYVALRCHYYTLQRLRCVTFCCDMLQGKKSDYTVGVQPRGAEKSAYTTPPSGEVNWCRKTDDRCPLNVCEQAGRVCCWCDSYCNWDPFGVIQPCFCCPEVGVQSSCCGHGWMNQRHPLLLLELSCPQIWLDVQWALRMKYVCMHTHINACMHAYKHASLLVLNLLLLYTTEKFVNFQEEQKIFV